MGEAKPPMVMMVTIKVLVPPLKTLYGGPGSGGSESGVSESEGLGVVASLTDPEAGAMARGGAEWSGPSSWPGREMSSREPMVKGW